MRFSKTTEDFKTTKDNVSSIVFTKVAQLAKYYVIKRHRYP